MKDGGLEAYKMHVHAPACINSVGECWSSQPTENCQAKLKVQG